MAINVSVQHSRNSSSCPMLCSCFIFPLPSDQIGGGFLVCYFSSLFFYLFFGCSDCIEREACVCDHGLEKSDLCAEIIIIIIIIIIIAQEVK